MSFSANSGGNGREHRAFECTHLPSPRPYRPVAIALADDNIQRMGHAAGWQIAMADLKYPAAFCFDALPSREPASTSLENALKIKKPGTWSHGRADCHWSKSGSEKGLKRQSPGTISDYAAMRCRPAASPASSSCASCSGAAFRSAVRPVASDRSSVLDCHRFSSFEEKSFSVGFGDALPAEMATEKKKKKKKN